MSGRAHRGSSGADPTEAVIARLERSTARAREAEAALEARIREAHGLTKDLHEAMREGRAELASAVEAKIKADCEAQIRVMGVEAARVMATTESRIRAAFDRLLDELVGARVGGLPGLEALVDRLASQSDAAAFAARFRASVVARAVTQRPVGSDGPGVASGPGRCSNTDPGP